MIPAFEMAVNQSRGKRSNSLGFILKTHILFLLIIICGHVMC